MPDATGYSKQAGWWGAGVGQMGRDLNAVLL